MTQKKPVKSKKSDLTRAAILAAARELFTSQGFDHTTVRDVAAKAKIDPAMVIRYFGSKDELFALAVEFDLRLPDLSKVPRDAVGATLAAHYFGLWEGENRNHGLPLLMRSAASNEFAAAKMREMFGKQVAPAIAALVGPAQAAACAGLVASQLLGMAFCRHIIKLPPAVAMPRDAMIKALGQTIQNYMLPRGIKPSEP
ncbi:MAG: TetR family transcriptional regulator [Rhodospirillaceae bacterium]|nr:TetR family transcriptional regulator [Rhodospirillaceae bacterium]